MKQSTYEIEAIGYDESCSPEIKTAILNRVQILEPGVVSVREIPVQTPYTLGLMMDRALTYCIQFEHPGIVIDIRESSRPDARSRRTIAEKFAKLAETTKHISFIIEGKLLATAIHFVMFGITNKSYSVHKDLASAIQAIKEK